MTSTKVSAPNTGLPPRYLDALNHFNNQRFEEALIVCEKILSVQTDCAEAIMLLGLISFELDEPHQAIELLSRAHEMEPEIADFAEALSSIHARTGNTTEALFLTKFATTLSPHPSGLKLLPDAFANFFENLESASPNKFHDRAERSLEAGDFKGAEDSARMQLNLTPGNPETLRILSKILRANGQKTRAIAAVHAVLLDCANVLDQIGLSRCLSEAGRHSEAYVVGALAAQGKPCDSQIEHCQLLNVIRDPDRTEAEIEKAKQSWYVRHTVAPEKNCYGIENFRQKSGKPRLRVAFIGSRFDNAEMVHMLAPIFSGLDRHGIDIFVYNIQKRESVLSDFLNRHVKRSTNLSGVDPETAAAIIRGDGIDVAVDLDGHGEYNHLTTFAYQPAPVCVSWCGDALPTAARFDYLMTGPAGWPDDSTAQYLSRKIWRLPDTPLVYPLATGLGAPSPLPILTTGYPTFGAMLNLASIGTSTLALWSEVLTAVPGARLMIANVARLDDECGTRIYELLSHAGIRHQVDIIDLDDTPNIHLDFLRLVDIAIDPQPFSSFVRTSKALWMGVPVIAVRGEQFRGRAGVTALTAARRQEWIANDTPAACELARELLQNLPALSDIRAELPDSIAASPLADGEALAGAMSVAFTEMVKRRGVSG